MTEETTGDSPAMDDKRGVRPLALLLVEDNPGDARLVRAVLPVGFDVHPVVRLDEALAWLGGNAVDVVLLDLSLPDSHGVETFQRLHKAFPDVAVLVLTALADDALAVQAVGEGAQDWLVKGALDGDAIARAIRYAIERHRLSARLVQLDRTRTMLISVVSHDLRNPASAIQAAVDLLLGGALGPLNPRQLHTLELMRRNAQRQTRLITDLLDLTVIEAGRLPLKQREAELTSLVRAAIDEVEPLLSARGLEVRAELGPEVPLRCDPDRISQALGNLLSNSMRFARAEIAVSVDAGPREVEVRVDDDGPGLGDLDPERIFEWFVRGDASTDGTGLGLPIVRGIAASHGGRVSASNRPEGGARFAMVLPRSR